MPRKFSTTILDTLLKTIEVELKVPLLGFGEIKFPISEQIKEWWKNEKTHEDLLTAIDTAEQKFTAQHPKNNAAQLLHDFSLKDEEGFQKVLKELLNNLDEQKITSSIAEKIGKGFERIITNKELQQALYEFTPYLQDELFKLQEFRETIIYLQQKRIESSTHRIENSTQRIEGILLESQASKSKEEATYTPELFTSLEDIPEASDFLPPASRVPFYRNKVFTGRIEDLKLLANSLLTKKTNTLITQTAAVIGIGGIGKTQLAVEFCYRYGKYFHGVHWINARDGNIDLEIAACGQEMNISNYPENLLDQLKTTLRHWRTTPLRLIVFDNLEDPNVLANWLPQLNGLCILVTARHREWSKDLGVEVHQIDTLPRDHSRILLRKLSPRLNNMLDERLDLLAERLGDLPLALDLAGRYLNSHPSLPLEEYLKRLEAQDNILSHTSLAGWVAGNNPTKHETSLASTFLVSLSQLDENDVDKLAKDLFIGAGYLKPSNVIPNQLFYGLSFLIQHPDFAQQMEQMPEVEEFEKTEENTDEALRRLSNIGLLGENNSIHPLISDFSRLQKNDDTTILSYLNTSFQMILQNIEYRGVSADILPTTSHLQTFIKYIYLLGRSDQVDFYSQYAKYLFLVGQYQSSIKIINEILEDLEKSKDKGTFVDTLNILGLAYREIGELKGAFAKITQALDIVNEHQLQGGQWATINNLGMIYAALGKNEEAIQCYKSVLENQVVVQNIKDDRIQKLLPDFTQKQILNTSSNLGLAYRATGQFDLAIKTFETTIDIGKKLYGDEHSIVARELGNIGLTYRDLSKFESAKQYLVQALRIYEITLGTNHPDTANAISNLGLAYQDLGEDEKALQHFEKALAIKEKIFGRLNHHVAIDLHNLGTILTTMGNHIKGIELLEEATEIEVKIYGEYHYEIAYNYRTLAFEYYSLNNYNKSRRMAEKALLIDKFIYKNDELPLGKDYFHLGLVSYHKKQYKRAVGELSRCIKIYEKYLPNDNIEITGIRSLLAKAQMQSKR